MPAPTAPCPDCGNDAGQIPTETVRNMVEPFGNQDVADDVQYRICTTQDCPVVYFADELDPKTVLLGVTVDGDTLGFPLPVVEATGGVVTATVGGTDVVVLATDEGLHAFELPEFELSTDDGRIVGDGTTWTPATGESEDGRRLRRVPTRRLNAFAWQDDHGPDAFYEE